jgi:hypothetical protein
MKLSSPNEGSRKGFQVFGESLVFSYLRMDANGNAVVVNVTLPDHPLFPGVVVRGVVNGVLHKVGEGLAKKQAIPLFSDQMFDNEWLTQSQRNFRDAK